MLNFKYIVSTNDQQIYTQLIEGGIQNFLLINKTIVFYNWEIFNIFTLQTNVVKGICIKSQGMNLKPILILKRK